MRYKKHYTQKEWDRFKVFIPKTLEDGTVYYLDTQEMMCKKYDIVIDDWQPRLARQINRIRKIVNQRNFNKTVNAINKTMQELSSAVGDLEKQSTHTKRKSRKKRMHNPMIFDW